MGGKRPSPQVVAAVNRRLVAVDEWAERHDLAAPWAPGAEEDRRRPGASGRGVSGDASAHLRVPRSSRSRPTGSPNRSRSPSATALCLRAEARPGTQPKEASIIFIDDLHWVDQGSDAFVAQLAEVAGQTRVLLLVNFRPDEYEAGWTRRFTINGRLAGRDRPLDRADNAPRSASGTRLRCPA